MNTLKGSLITYSSDDLAAYAYENARNRDILYDIVEELNRRERKRKRRNNRAQAVLATTQQLLAECPPTGLRPPEPQPALPLYPWQKEALDAWRSANSKGIVEAVTGGGKTRLAIAAIGDQIRSGRKSAVLVPSVILLHQWYSELVFRIPNAVVARLGDGYDGCLQQCDILVATCHMAARWEISDGSCDSLLVADEVHRFGAATFRLGLEEAFTKRLGISATWERPDGATETVHKPYFGGVVFTLSFSRARQEDIIAKFNLALIGVSLQGKEADDYNDLGEEIRRRRRQLENQFDAPEKDEDFFLWLQGARKGRDSGAAKVVGFYDSAITKRRKLLTEAGGKAEVVADAARAINREKRVIIFTETTDAADKIAKSWSSQNRACKPYHTGISKQIQEETLRAFSKGDLTSIAVAKKFDEGVDIPDADVAFIASTSRSDTQLVQRAGRVLRKKGDSREALIVLLYAINTVEDPEKGTLSKALEDLEGAAKQTRRVHWQGSFIDILSCFGKKWV